MISIIIPVYNDRKGVSDTLSSLLAITYPKENMEIIVVDNGSSDGTVNAVEEFQKIHPSLIKLLSVTSVQSSYAARNEGISSSRGDILVFLDADMTVAPDFLEKIEDFLSRTEAMYVGFNVVIPEAKRENIFQKYDRLTGFPIESFIEHKHFTGAGCLAATRTLFDKIGVFNGSLISSGDLEFGNRAYNSGIKLHFVQSVTALHPARNSLQTLAKQHFRKGRGRCQMRTTLTKISNSGIGLKKDYNKISIMLRIKNFKFKVTGWKALNLREKVCFFLLWVSLSLIEHAGFYCEKLKAWT
jgi:glycosyltransferase AglI